MRKFFSIFTGIVLGLNSFGQDAHRVDSLKRILLTSSDDTTKGHAILGLCGEFIYTKPDSCLYYGALGFDLIKNPEIKRQFESSNSFDLRNFEVRMYRASAIALSEQRSDSLAIKMGLKALELADRLKNERVLFGVLGSLGEVYQNIGEPAVSLEYNKKALALDGTEQGRQIGIASIGACFYDLGQYDSALNYLNRIDPEFRIGKNPWPYPDTYLGNTYAKKGEFLKAISFYKSSIRKSIESQYTQDLSQAYAGLSNTFKAMGKIDSGIVYAGMSLQIADKYAFPGLSLHASDLLSSLYESKGMIDSAFKYQKISNILKDTIFNKEKIQQVQSFTFIEKLRQKDLDLEKTEYQNKVKFYTLLAGLAGMVLVAVFLIRNNRFKQKANLKLETSYAELKATQAQLIQSEKMASLGELTAGIAHEIQNPLNFVNNFSEVNKELLAELDQEIDKGNMSEVKSIAKDVMDNEDKISHHGKRADAIVKGMLQHSRISSGIKETTDINALADEYLRLAYQGLRAKDKSFNATLKTDFDPSIGNINIIPQDIGRVLLNLINNAFYAVDERSKAAVKGYEPEVTISTRLLTASENSLIRQSANSLIISVKDNGNGIPEQVLDKVFQPFFTTKPTGQGTGLGLSLSYDIVKAHQGTLNIRNTPGAGAEFIITLPINA